MATAAEVLERTLRAHASCATYRDEGEVVTVMSFGAKPYQQRTERIVFRTAFVRPDAFSFRFREATVGPESEWSLYAVWARGGRARSWWSLNEQTNEHESILHALSGPTGVSKGSAIRVPHLLLGERCELSLPAAEGATLREDVLEGGTRCHVVRGSLPMNRVAEHWIDATTHLLRKVREESSADSMRELVERARENIRHSPEFDETKRRELLSSFESRPELPGMTTTTTTVRPEVDVPIAPEELDFTPA